MNPRDAYIQELGTDGRMIGVRSTQYGAAYADVYPEDAELDEAGNPSVSPEKTLLVMPDGYATDVTTEREIAEQEAAQDRLRDAGFPLGDERCQRHGSPVTAGDGQCDACRETGTADPG